jgi:hypothetical protein
MFALHDGLSEKHSSAMLGIAGSYSGRLLGRAGFCAECAKA